ncbi:MAG: helix-hairpin-helix domain-containing protein [Ignavibacteriales bacterium]|nr:helix-hairpin-helix domain-containing protein [Ignavibacteriales bacterium]
MIQRLINWLALTPTERNVILFLTLTLVIGAAIRFYQERISPDRQFDYASVDSTFAVFQKRVTSDSLRQNEGASNRVVNINMATKAELTSLPGIGDVLADRIIRQREEQGEFETISELQKVKGISKKKFEKLKPLIAVQ